MKDNNKKENKDLQENVHKSDDENIDINKKDETSYVGVFMTIGTGLGVSFGIIFDNLALGISIGTALGLVIGAVVESMKEKN